jgi:hypothetical protein
VYAEPSLQSAVVGTLARGAVVSCLATSQEGLATYVQIGAISPFRHGTEDCYVPRISGATRYLEPVPDNETMFHTVMRPMEVFTFTGIASSEHTGLLAPGTVVRCISEQYVNERRYLQIGEDCWVSEMEKDRAVVLPSQVVSLGAARTEACAVYTVLRTTTIYAGSAATSAVVGELAPGVLVHAIEEDDGMVCIAPELWVKACIGSTATLERHEVRHTYYCMPRTAIS